MPLAPALGYKQLAIILSVTRWVTEHQTFRCLGVDCPLAPFDTVMVRLGM